MDINVIGIYGSHDSAFSFIHNNQIRILELEKFNGHRNCSLSRIIESKPKASDEEFYSYLNYIKKEFDINSIQTVVYNQLFEKDRDILQQIFNVKTFSVYDHHEAHGAASFYQSPFNEALVVTFDGGGEGSDKITSFFNFYIVNRKEFRHVHRVNLNLGTGYEKHAFPIKQIRKTTNPLMYAGKLMGLSSYGKKIDKWMVPIETFYKTQNYLNFYNETGIDLRIADSLDEEQGIDLAFTAQIVFQKLFEESFFPVWKQYSHLPVCFSGGGALNVLNNQIWFERLNGNLFIPPNPNDCGLAFGGLARHLNFKEPVDVTFSGYDIFGETFIGTLVEINEIADLIVSGKIVGSIMGRSEIGPRALGNRSVLCDPSIPNMKDILNSKVKFREWFRPFAPVVRLEDINKYFEFSGESRFMNFCPKIKEKYKNLLNAIVHVDGTTRVQTVTKEQHSFLYSLLTELEKKGKIPILLNTSFNIRGKSMVNSVSDALEILKTTELDAVLINGNRLIRKPL